MKRFLLIGTGVIAVIYVLVCTLLYVYQERLIFLPRKLDKSFQFEFNKPFEEKIFPMADGKKLDGILFKCDSSKGLIFYLHGNAGNLSSWGNVARTYTDLNYDVFMLDYRGYGKSEGKINGQGELFDDLQTVYDQLKKSYPEHKIIVLGYSIGTGPAAKLASANNPKLLILQAPYYSLTDMMTHNYPGVPTFILKYKFETNQYLRECKMPVVIFHGDQDAVVSYESSVRLKAEMGDKVKLISLPGWGHNGMSENKEYRGEVRKLLVRL